jgi:transcriptional regulator with PAS, ATPase and Fis domain
MPEDPADPEGICWLFPEPLLTPVASKRTLLGRGDDCDGVLPGRETSRHHAEIRRDGPLCLLRDLASRNGVFVNGVRFNEGPLELGDVLRLGEWVGLLAALPTGFGGAQQREIADGLVGGFRLERAIDPARRAAQSALPIVVQGETGAGKECVSRAIHAWSGRSGKFVAVNCAALPESLAEAELFGHRKGAFTGASQDSAGYFRAAHGGTLLLDEIAELLPAVQAKLLRVIERGEVIPLGDTRPIEVDVRLVVAAQIPLRLAVAEKRFRPDLFARLDGVTVELPPLRERREDIVGLFVHLLERFSGGRPPRLEAELVERLLLHDFPYNVRELVQLVKRMLALHALEPAWTEAHVRGAIGPAVRQPEMAREPARHEPRPSAARARRAHRNLALLEKLGKALERHTGNLSRAAAAVGISRQRAYRLLEQAEASGAVRPASEEGAAKRSKP